VLAHEIAHIQLGHSIKAIKSSRTLDALMAGANAALAVSDISLSETVSALNDSVNDIVTVMATKGYSQTQEYDADKTALSLMLSAGYDPSAMTDMLNLLDKQAAGKKSGFASTHPSPQNRLKQVSDKLKKAPYTAFKSRGRDARNGRFAKNK
jgi:predicted Zn-dependent protease